MDDDQMNKTRDLADDLLGCVAQVGSIHPASIDTLEAAAVEMHRVDGLVEDTANYLRWIISLQAGGHLQAKAEALLHRIENGTL